MSDLSSIWMIKNDVQRDGKSHKIIIQLENGLEIFSSAKLGILSVIL